MWPWPTIVHLTQVDQHVLPSSLPLKYQLAQEWKPDPKEAVRVAAFVQCLAEVWNRCSHYASWGRNSNGPKVEGREKWWRTPSSWWLHLSLWIKPLLNLNNLWTFHLCDPINSLYGLSCLTWVFWHSQSNPLPDTCSPGAHTGQPPAWWEPSGGLRCFEVAFKMLAATSETLTHSAFQGSLNMDPYLGPRTRGQGSGFCLHLGWAWQ